MASFHTRARARLLVSTFDISMFKRSFLPRKNHAYCRPTQGAAREGRRAITMHHLRKAAYEEGIPGPYWTSHSARASWLGAYRKGQNDFPVLALY